MNLPPLLKEATEKTYSSWAEANELSDEEKNTKFRRSVSVTAKYKENLRKELRAGDVTWFSDAGKGVGGLGEHPGALAHFVAGLPLCQMTHYAERASVQGLKIDDLEMGAVAHYIGLSGHSFDEVEYTVALVSEESPEDIRRLAFAAAGDCYVTNTLKRGCRVTGHIFLNGKHLADQ